MRSIDFIYFFLFYTYSICIADFDTVIIYSQFVKKLYTNTYNLHQNKRIIYIILFAQLITINIIFSNQRLIINIFQMRQQQQQQFYSLDEYKSFDDLNQSISWISPQQINRLQCSVCLQNEIDCLNFEHDVQPQDLQRIQNNIQALSNFQKQISQKLYIFTNYVKQTKENEQIIHKELDQFKVMVKNKCPLPEHHLIQVQLAKMKQLVDTNQLKIKQLKEQSNKKNSYQLNNKLENNTTLFPSRLKLGSVVQSFKIQNKNNYNQQVHLIIYKNCIFKRTVQLYQDDQVTILYNKNPEGIRISTINKQNNKIQIKIKNKVSKIIDIKLEDFQKGKFVQNCTVLNPKRFFSLPIPLPLNMLFQKRFQNYANKIKYEKIKQLMTFTEIAIKHYDVKTYQQILSNPKILHFQKNDNTLISVFNIKKTNLLYLIQIQRQKQSLLVSVGYRMKDYLAQILEFYSFVLCQ